MAYIRKTNRQYKPRIPHDYTDTLFRKRYLIALYDYNDDDKLYTCLSLDELAALQNKTVQQCRVQITSNLATNRTHIIVNNNYYKMYLIDTKDDS